MDADESPPQPAKQGSPDTKKHANAASWQQGQSGNPAGRPRKGQAMTDILDRLSDMPLAEVKKLRPAQLSAKEAIARQVLLEGMKTSGQKDRAYLFDRLDGKPRTSVQLLGETSEAWEQLGQEWDDLDSQDDDQPAEDGP